MLTISSQAQCNDVFQKACLIQFNSNCWTNSKKIPASLIKEKFGREEEDKEWIRGFKNLLDPEGPAPIRTIIGRAKRHMKQQALPFPIDSFNMISKEMIESMDTKMKEYETDFWNEVQKFIIKLPDLIQKAKESLPPELFNPLDYPTQEEMLDKFGFSWKYVNISTPNNNGISILTPEIYERERKKFIETIDETRVQCVEAMREKFLELTGHLVERMSPNEDGTPKKFKNSLFDNFFEFFELLKTNNIFGDSLLDDIAKEAKGILNKVTPDHIKTYDLLRKKLTQDFKKMETKLEEDIVDRPIRKLRFDI